jgi:hypothetical protein
VTWVLVRFHNILKNPGPKPSGPELALKFREENASVISKSKKGSSRSERLTLFVLY